MTLPPVIKRVIDVLAASLGLLVAAPLFAVVAAAIRLQLPGPVIYRQERVGVGVMVHPLQVPHDEKRHTGVVYRGDGAS